MSDSAHPKKKQQENSVTDLIDTFDPSIQDILPHGKMYNVQIGNERFVISGASLSSDAPSYFTNYFLDVANSEKVLFIDRSPDIFQYIYRHLQGYYLEIPDADIFTRLFTDALYYNLPKLLNALKNHEYYFVLISGESIKFSKTLLQGAGNKPNFFSISNDALYKDISELIMNRKWIRPPPQAAPTLNRSAALLRELILLLQGVEIEIRSDEHRRSLIKEAKYYRFNALVQQLVKHKLYYNPFTLKEEIIIPLEYIDPKSVLKNSNGSLFYKRPDIDSFARPLRIQIDKAQVSLSRGDSTVFIVEFLSQTSTKLKKILSPLSSNPQIYASTSSNTLKVTQSIQGLVGASIQLNGIFLTTGDNGEIYHRIHELSNSSTLAWYLTKSVVQITLDTSASGDRIDVQIRKAKAITTETELLKETDYFI